MPANSAGQIEIVVDVVDQATHDYSQQDTAAHVSQIPAGAGTLLRLPSAQPNDGDRYEFADIDGSCAPGHPLAITDPNGNFIAGSATRTFASPFSTGIVRFDAQNKVWSLLLSTGSAGPTAMLIFPTIADMAAFDVSTILPSPQNGVQAFVQSNNSLWTLQGGALGTDGITIVDATGLAGAQWLRNPFSGAQPFYLQQTTWLVDSIAGNDENDGITSRIKTKAEIMRRWGYTWEPDLDAVNVTIQYFSTDEFGDGEGNDPGFFSPNLINGATLTHMAALPAPSFTGTLLAVSPKNTGAGGQGLQATFTTATGAMAAGLLLVNATRGNSRAIVAENVGGSTFLIYQPFAPYVLGTFPTPTEVDTWADGDAITGYALLPIDFARIGGTCAAFDSVFGPSHVAYQLNIVDASSVDFGAGTIQLDPSANLAIIDCNVTRGTSIARGFTEIVFSQFINVDFQGQIQTAIIIGGAVKITGGGCHSAGQVHSVILAGDFAILDGLFAEDCTIPNGEHVLAQGSTLFARGQFVAAGTGTVYGTGTVDAVGRYIYNAAAATVLPVANLLIQGNGQGYGVVSALGATLMYPLSVTAAHLDAAAGPSGAPTGFGGMAFLPVGSGFYRTGVNP